MSAHAWRIRPCSRASTATSARMASLREMTLRKQPGTQESLTVWISGILECPQRGSQARLNSTAMFGSILPLSEARLAVAATWTAIARVWFRPWALESVSELGRPSGREAWSLIQRWARLVFDLSLIVRVNRLVQLIYCSVAFGCSRHPRLSSLRHALKLCAVAGAKLSRART